MYTAQKKGEPGASYIFPDPETGNPEGAKIFFCHLDDPQSIYAHDGFEYQFVGFDELTHFLLKQYLYLMSRMRSTVEGINTRIRATAMWEGAYLWWVKKRFRLDEPGKVRYYLSNPKPEENPRGIEVSQDTPYSRSRCFIRGYLTENRYVNKDEYIGNVKQLGAAYEDALINGNPDALTGDFFPFTFEMMVEPFQIPPQWRLIGSLDPGWTSPCSFGLTAIDFEGTAYRLGTYYERDRNDTQNAEGVKSYIDNFKPTGGRMPELIVSGTDAFAKKNMHAIMSNELTFANVFASYGLMLQPAVTDRVLGWGAMKDLMNRGKYKIFKTFNGSFVEEIQSAQRDEKNPNDLKGRGLDPHVSDHALDEARYGIMSFYTPSAPQGRREKTWEEEFTEKGQAKEWKPGRL